MNAATATNEQLQRALEIHLDPKWGSNYWLQRQAELVLDIRDRIRTTDDLRSFPTMLQSDLSGRSLLDYMPRRLHDALSSVVLGQTGGSTGQSVWTAYTRQDFESAFVDPFVAAAAAVGFEGRGCWLYVGPSGPHIIARAARALARACGSCEPFSVDLDPGWSRRLPADSFAAGRYLEHILRQALEVLLREPITVIFSTPSVLKALAPKMTSEQRHRIKGVHYGGQAVTRWQIDELRNEWLPMATHLSGYGNTLMGCCLELDTQTPDDVIYYPYGDRLWFNVLTDSAGGDGADPVLRDEGEGQLVFCRFDESMLLLNFVERDHVALQPSTALTLAGGFQRQCLINPGPGNLPAEPPSVGLY